MVLGAVVVAVGIWWTANTVAHLLIHRPVRGAARGAMSSLGLSAVMGIPQSLWRDRHLAHHAGLEWTLRPSPQLAIETGLILAIWAMLATTAAPWFLGAYVPGYLAALGLCALQGHYEHAGGTTSHYGWLYNRLCFNDGFHVEHHRWPGVPWSELPARADPHARASRWPPVLRWLDAISLDTLERLVLHSRWLQRRVLACHRRAIAALLPELPRIERVAIVGGGLFPRTALILRELLPSAHLVIIDASAANLETARSMMIDGADFIHRRYEAGKAPAGIDLLVVPLAFTGDRQAVYRSCGARAAIVHDWIWRRRGISRVVSPALLKRVNLVFG